MNAFISDTVSTDNDNRRRTERKYTDRQKAYNDKVQIQVYTA